MLQNRMGSALFDQDNVILSGNNKKGNNNESNAMLTPGQIMGRMGGEPSSRPEYDTLMRMNTGKSVDLLEDDFNQMLNGSNALD